MGVNQFIRDNPAVAALAFLVVWGLLGWALARIINRLDRDVQTLRKQHHDMRNKFTALVVENEKLKATIETSRGEQHDHMRREETTFWPKIDNLAVEINSAKEEDIRAHAVIGERLTRLETLVAGNGRK
jgi:hypothetical protein